MGGDADHILKDHIISQEINDARKAKIKRCDRCGGTMVLLPEPDCAEWDCLQCGRRQEERPMEDFWYKRLSTEERRRYVEEAVLRGCKITSQKYGIPLYTLVGWMGGFKIKSSGGRLPQYPAYNDAWPESVKIAWLEGYKNLPGHEAKVQ